MMFNYRIWTPVRFLNMRMLLENGVEVSQNVRLRELKREERYKLDIL